MMELWDESALEGRIRHYGPEHHALRALLGGIGTGNISLDSCGSYRDFELFGHPDRGLKLPYCFQAIRVSLQDGRTDARILEALPPREHAQRLAPSGYLLGLPRFAQSDFSCRYPFQRIRFLDQSFPLSVSMEAFTPMIPLDTLHSSMPYFRLRYTVKNFSDQDAEVSIAASLLNACGFRSFDGFDYLEQAGTRRNTIRRGAGCVGVSLDADGLDPEDVACGSMALACEDGNASIKPHWQFGGWWDGAEEFWQDFCNDGALNQAVPGPSQPVQGERCVASAAQKKRLAPGEEADFTFYIAWHFPNRLGWWPDGHMHLSQRPEHAFSQKNWYASHWRDAWNVIEYARENEEMLERGSRLFAGALYGSSLDADVIEELIASIVTLRSCTCFRIEDGTFFAWEGCFDHAGSCAGNCTHVWNYAQTLAFLYPELERNMRETEFLTETDAQGCMAFRAKRRLEGKAWEHAPAADGHLGSILRVYREWQLSGDRDFLQALWPQVKNALAYAMRTWDPDGDGVLEAWQDNTYDIAFVGISSLTNAIFYAALLASAAMGESLGETELPALWRDMAQKGSLRMDRLLWNGSYYIQRADGVDLIETPYQYGQGCLADQLFGQELAHLYGLGYLFPPDHVRHAMKAIYQNNFHSSLQKHSTIQRTFAFGSEGGLTLCSWPCGGRPKQPFVYSDEVWTGIELQVAVSLLYEDMIDEAMTLVRAIRARYDGMLRSPFDEVECGSHYARSLAAWGLLIALSGYECSVPHRRLHFAPRVKGQPFQCFYSTGNSWGIYYKGEHGERLVPLYGEETCSLE